MARPPSSFDLSGRLALVTGGAGLLGIQHTRALAACGAVVAIGDIDFAGAERAVGEVGREFGSDRVVAVDLDVTNRESITAAHETLLERHGGVGILVNNAAIDPKVGDEGRIVESSRVEHFSLEQWVLELAVGLTGAFLCCQVFGAWMAANGGGVILNIASDLSVIAPDQRIYRRDGLAEDRQPVKPVTYSVIKTGLVGLTRYLAAYWAQDGVRVNALSPAGVYTGQPDEFVARLTELIPMGRMAAEDEYVAAVQFLCSSASQYMTGQNIVIDGGRSVW